MKRKMVFTLISFLTLFSTAVWAGPIGPAEKLPNAPTIETAPAAGSVSKWYLQNGAFDDGWDGDTPHLWQVYLGNADAYGALDFLSPDGSAEIVDNAFVFQIVNDEIQADRNAYLYQKIPLSQGDYWLNVHSTIYGNGTGYRDGSGSDASLAYNYMAYYALVPQDTAMKDGSFAPGQVPAKAWKELWPWSNVCSDELKGWGVGDKWSDCDYVKRAETVSVAGGDYVFILRARLQWPDWRAFAFYIFDDIQIIDATPYADNWNACVTSYCLEGLVDR